MKYEGGLDYKTVIGARAASFLLQREYTGEMTVSRGLYMSSRGEGYVTMLPKYRGLSLIAIIAQKIQQNGSVNILDIGCGAGIELIDINKIWGEQANCSGITARLFEVVFDKESDATNLDLHQQLGINIQIGDAHRLRDYFNPGQFDIITSVFAAMYLADPFAMLEEAYDLLKPGGIGLINNFQFRLEYPRLTIPLLRCFLANHFGIVSSQNTTEEYWPAYDLSFMKTRTQLDLPVSYSRVSNVLRYQELVYRLEPHNRYFIGGLLR